MIYTECRLSLTSKYFIISKWKFLIKMIFNYFTIVKPRSKYKSTIRSKGAKQSASYQLSIFIMISHQHFFQVGDLVYVEKGHRVPADMILLRTTEVDGSCFLRTDQLDGETDWKKREAIPATQNIRTGDEGILNFDDASCFVQAPSKVLSFY